jgi:hypothetical protein
VSVLGVATCVPPAAADGTPEQVGRQMARACTALAALNLPPNVGPFWLPECTVADLPAPCHIALLSRPLPPEGQVQWGWELRAFTDTEAAQRQQREQTAEAPAAETVFRTADESALAAGTMAWFRCGNLVFTVTWCKGVVAGAATDAAYLQEGRAAVKDMARRVHEAFVGAGVCAPGQGLPGSPLPDPATPLSPMPPRTPVARGGVLDTPAIKAIVGDVKSADGRSVQPHVALPARAPVVYLYLELKQQSPVGQVEIVLYRRDKISQRQIILANLGEKFLVTFYATNAATFPPGQWSVVVKMGDRTVGLIPFTVAAP